MVIWVHGSFLFLKVKKWFNIDIMTFNINIMTLKRSEIFPSSDAMKEIII